MRSGVIAVIVGTPNRTTRVELEPPITMSPSEPRTMLWGLQVLSAGVSDTATPDLDRLPDLTIAKALFKSVIRMSPDEVRVIPAGPLSVAVSALATVNREASPPRNSK